MHDPILDGNAELYDLYYELVELFAGESFILSVAIQDDVEANVVSTGYVVQIGSPLHVQRTFVAKNRGELVALVASYKQTVVSIHEVKR